MDGETLNAKMEEATSAKGNAAGKTESQENRSLTRQISERLN